MLVFPFISITLSSIYNHILEHRFSIFAFICRIRNSYKRFKVSCFAKINVYQLYFIFSATFKSDYMICRFRILGGSGARDCFVSFDCVFFNLTQVFISKIGKKFWFQSHSLMAIGVELN